MPIAHGEGSYFADQRTIDELESNQRVVFRYCNSSGVADRQSNPNGSLNNIAGIISADGNVMGLMPHPERVCDTLLGGTDGLGIFHSLAQHFQTA
jgi:phosphoribosylformylglycinamidine synthase